MKKSVAYARLLRIPGLGALAIPPVIGALTVGVFDIYTLIILFAVGAFAAIYGFILNDFADVELDKLVPELHGKPLVSGDISRKTAVAVCVFCILFAFLFINFLWRGTYINDNRFFALVSIFLAGFLGSLYNLYGKRVPGSDLLVAISMGFVFLFGTLAVGASPNELTWIIFILTFNQTLHMNAVEGGIKDADHDYIQNVRNIALTTGVKVDGTKLFIPTHFKAFGMIIRLCSTILLFLPFMYFSYPYELWQLIVLAVAIIGVLFFNIKLLWLNSFDRTKIRKYIGIQSFLRYSVVPIMLISIIGLVPSVILIVFPIAWYIVFTPLLGEKLFKPRM